LLEAQQNLYSLMAEVATDPEKATKVQKILPETIQTLEEHIQTLGAKLQMPQGFILPGDSQPSASLALSRAIVRRAERRVVEHLDLQSLARYLPQPVIFILFCPGNLCAASWG